MYMSKETAQAPWATAIPTFNQLRSMLFQTTAYPSFQVNIQGSICFFFRNLFLFWIRYRIICPKSLVHHIKHLVGTNNPTFPQSNLLLATQWVKYQPLILLSIAEGLVTNLACHMDNPDCIQQAQNKMMQLLASCKNSTNGTSSCNSLYYAQDIQCLVSTLIFQI